VVGLLASKSIVASTLAIILLSLLVLTIDADSSIVIEPNGEFDLTPIYTGSTTTGHGEEIQDLCVTDTGIAVSVSITFAWWCIRGPAPTSIIAWNSNGEALWSKTYDTWTLKPYSVATDNEFIYVTGCVLGGLVLVKYTIDGDQLWNITWDSGNSEGEVGLDVILIDEGHIIVTGEYGSYSAFAIQPGFVVAFDSEGSYLWHYVSDSRPHATYCEGYIYMDCNSSIQKLTPEGTQLSITQHENRVLSYNSKNGKLYALSGSDFIYGDDWFARFYTKELFITRWNTTLVDIAGVTEQQRIWTTNITLYNQLSQICNISCASVASFPDGSLVMLLEASASSIGRSWHILSISNNGNVRWSKYIMDDYDSARIAIKESGLLFFIAGNFGSDVLSMAIFNITELIPDKIDEAHISNTTYFSAGDQSLNLQLISITAIGVVLFDCLLVAILKKKQNK